MDDPELDAEAEAASIPALMEGYQTQLKTGKFTNAVQSEANDLLAPRLPNGPRPM